MFKRYVQDIMEMIPEGSRILDLGCGRGELLHTLKVTKDVQSVGMDISQENVVASIAQGISTIQGDIDAGLPAFPDKSFDYVILSQTLQVVRKPAKVLQEMVRVGQKAIVSVPNFGHWSLRAQILFKGRMPKNRTLGYEWYDTPNIHLASMKDVQILCEEQKIQVLERKLYRSSGKPVCPISLALGNLMAETAVFVIQK
jgi:methionine biosynthesis protein MetW